MSDFGHSTIPEAVIFARQRAIPVMDDLRVQPMTVKPGLVRHDATGSFEQSVTDTGANYLFTQLDYFEERPDQEQNIRASRMIAIILGGKRTELAYWTQAAPTKQIDVHQGLGNLAVGDPADGSLKIFQLDPEVTPHITLPAGRFYAFHAHPWTPEPLVVSGLYRAETPVDWAGMEIYFEPGQETIEAPEGTIPVPPVFHDIFKRHGG